MLQFKEIIWNTLVIIINFAVYILIFNPFTLWFSCLRKKVGNYIFNRKTPAMVDSWINNWSSNNATAPTPLSAFSMSMHFCKKDLLNLQISMFMQQEWKHNIVLGMSRDSQFSILSNCKVTWRKISSTLLRQNSSWLQWNFAIKQTLTHGCRKSRCFTEHTLSSDHFLSLLTSADGLGKSFIQRKTLE